MKIGFSGTREGMSDDQFGRVKALISVLTRVLKPNEAHHGGCIGADAQFHRICLIYKLPVVVHPAKGVVQGMKANCLGAAETRPARAPLDRNKEIVNEVELMIFTPKETQPVLRSGTWATWRYAMKKGISIHLVLPDGLMYERGVDEHDLRCC